MNRKTIAISLIMLCTIGAVMGALVATTLAQSDTNSTNNQTATSTQTTQDPTQQFGAGMMNQGFGMGPGGQGGRMQQQEMMGNSGMSNYEVTTEYTANVNSILGNDTDVANLLSQGYNVTSIHPIVKNVIQGDGTITTAASTAIVTLQNGTQGYSTVNVDVTNAKVTYIETITRTVIDKTSS
jgi:hypothetical protein